MWTLAGPILVDSTILATSHGRVLSSGGSPTLSAQMSQAEVRVARLFMAKLWGPQVSTLIQGEATWSVKSKPCFWHQLEHSSFIVRSYGNGER